MSRDCNSTASPYFVTDPEGMEAALDEPVILIHENKITSIKDLLPLLEQVARAGKPLLIIAEDVEAEALVTLVVNRSRGTLAIGNDEAGGDRPKTTRPSLAEAGRKRRSTGAAGKSGNRSRRLLPIMTARSCTSGWRSSPAEWR